ncbi:TPM domain-containing protein [Paenibacillus gansuensis]|uniref:TPM domain-containing protein n=1 Tax=Paenibacillus gansuensis TaxID=306542 RepID=A0ABW5P7P4_9BACL
MRIKGGGIGTLRVCILALCMLFLVTAGVAAAPQIPPPVGDIYIQDRANVLSQEQRQALTAIGRSLDDQTGAQVAVLTIETLGGEAPEDYANAAFRKYQLGDREKNNGVLLLLAMQEHEIRIEVGYGLEGAIPDAAAGRILDEYAIPYLRGGRPDQAVVAAYQAISARAAEEYGVKLSDGGPPAPNPALAQTGGGFPLGWGIAGFIALIVLDAILFKGRITRALFALFLAGGGRGGWGGGGGRGGWGGGGTGGGGFRGGGGGSSGGGGAGRKW